MGLLGRRQKLSSKALMRPSLRRFLPSASQLFVFYDRFTAPILSEPFWWPSDGRTDIQLVYNDLQRPEMNFSASTGTGRRAALSFGQFFFCSQQVVSILAGLQGLYRYLMGTCGSTSLVSHTASSMYLLYLPNNHDLLSILYRVLCCVTQGTMRRRRSFGQHQTSALHPKWKRASFIEREVLTSTDRDTVLLMCIIAFLLLLRALLLIRLRRREPNVLPNIPWVGRDRRN